MPKYCIVKVADNSMMSESAKDDMPTADSYTYIGLIDRTKNKEHWWTGKPDMLMKFSSKEAAEAVCNKQKYGKPLVVTEENAIRRITHWHTKTRHSTLGQLLDQHEMLWHDDDWHEQHNSSQY